ncbi:MAG: hypothetical protein ACRD7E_23825, partial [Bryobacteraceae bacterium]
MYQTSVWPVTWLMVSVLQGGTLIFLYTIATIYTGEAVWRERDVRLDQIHDSLPIPTWLNVATQFAAIAAVQVILLLVIMICGIVLQAWTGYYNFELPVYFKELFLIVLPGLLSFNLFCLFLHTFLSNKFLAHAVVVGIFVLTPILYRYGLESRLLLIGDSVPYTYSDMNGYGHFVPGLASSLIYWLAFGMMCGVVALAFSRRGVDLAWRSRAKTARARTRTLVPAGTAALLLFAGTGAWFYYNAYVLNEFETSEGGRRRQAEYERLFKKYELTAQPKIVGVEANVDIFPERRSLSAQGRYMLVNRSSEPISEIHITADRETLKEIRFDRKSRLQLHDKRLGYQIYRLAEPLEPGAAMRLDFRAGYESRGFK